MKTHGLGPALVSCFLIVAACAPAAGPPRAPDSAAAPVQAAQPVQPKALTIALQGEPAALDLLMGEKVEPRREFIQKHALDVKDIDYHGA